MTSTMSIEESYLAERMTLERACREILHQIEVIVQGINIQLGFPIQFRIKDLSSVLEKVERLPRFDDIRKFQDLIGFRIIVLFARDISSIENELIRNFILVRKYNPRELLNADQFGYSSTHLVFKLKEEWLQLPNFSGLQAIIFEVQIRTLPQHMWAEASHILQYKQEKAIPLEVRRSIYRISALLETIDLEFERLLVERENYRKKIIDLPPKQSQQLNVDIMESILLANLPRHNKSPNEDYGTLITCLESAGINSPEKVINLIKTYAQKAETDDIAKAKDILAKYEQRNQHIPDYLINRAKKGVYYSHVGLMQQMIKYYENSVKKG